VHEAWLPTTMARCRTRRSAQVCMGLKLKDSLMPDTRQPSELQPEERLREIAIVFARAYHRFRLDGPAVPPLSDAPAQSDQKEGDQ